MLLSRVGTQVLGTGTGTMHESIRNSRDVRQLRGALIQSKAPRWLGAQVFVTDTAPQHGVAMRYVAIPK